MQTILVYRFSAMGDVALVAPAIKSLLQQKNEVNVVFVSRNFFLSFFDNHERLTKVGVDLDKYKGFLGLRKLYLELKRQYHPDVVIDLHDVLRTQLLNTFFKFSGYKVFKIDKGREEKKAMIASKKVEVPLKSSLQRYFDVFKKAGYSITLTSGPWIQAKEELNTFFSENNLFKTENKWVGIAPFAKHETKIWGLNKIEELILLLVEQNYQVFLFGGGDEELVKLNYLANKQGVINASGQLNFKQEMSLMTHLDVMVTMDSSNMHIASLLGVRVISIWGSTHPSLGFPPINNEDGVVLTKEKLNCQPCSVFGNKPCSRGDHACMKLITPSMVFDKI